MRTSTAATMVIALGAALVLVTGCASGSPSSGGAVSLTGARSTATATRTVPTKGLVGVIYRKWNFRAVRPVAWRRYPFEFIRPEEGTIGYLSSDRLHNPCGRTATTAACEEGRVLSRLSSHGVLIEWVLAGWPPRDAISDFPGHPLSVGGHPARLVGPKPATDQCRSEGGAVQIQGTVRWQQRSSNLLQLDACIGPDAGTAAEDAVNALFRSIEFLGG
jgi:hypothetical protein